LSLKEYQVTHSKSEFQAVLSGSVVNLTWTHDHDPLSKNDVELEVARRTFLSRGHYCAVDSILFTINGGQQIVMNLISEFGLMSTVVRPDGALTQFDGFRNDRIDDICVGAAMILSDLNWFHKISDSITKPFRFAGGCILPPNQLVIK